MDYRDDIFEHLLVKESKELIVGDLFAKQKVVAEKSWGVLVNWIYAVCRLRYGQPGIGITCRAIEILNHYLQKVEATKENFQLIGSVCMMLASKNETMYIDEIIGVEDVKKLNENRYSEEAIIAKELDVFTVVDFNVNYVTPVDFRGIYPLGTPLEKPDASGNTITFADPEGSIWSDQWFRFLLDFAVLCPDVYTFTPSVRVQAVLHLLSELENKPSIVSSGEVFECVEVLDKYLTILKEDPKKEDPKSDTVLVMFYGDVAYSILKKF